MFTYRRIGWTKIELTGFKKGRESAELTIPRKYRGRKVVSIGEGAFENKGIEKLKLTTNLDAIKDRAFAGNEISEINIGECGWSVIPNLKSSSFEGSDVNILKGLDSYDFWRFANTLGVEPKYIELSKSESNNVYDIKFLRLMPSSVEGVYVEKNLLHTVKKWSMSINPDVTIYTKGVVVCHLDSVDLGREIVQVDSADHFRDIIKLSNSF